MDTRNRSKLARHVARQMVSSRRRVGTASRVSQRVKSLAAEQKEDRVAILDAKVFRGMARGRAANVEIGAALIELKKILGHGRWQRHFKEAFAPHGLTLRTAENYMRAAREADSKIEKVSIFKPATDRGARTIRAATERAQTEVAGSSGHKLKKENISGERPALYRLPLHMSGDEMDACDTLQKSPEWQRFEQRILALLKQIWTEYGG